MNDAHKAVDKIWLRDYPPDVPAEIDPDSIPSLKQRAGDFSDWRDSSGRLIPIYDPATTRVLPDGTVTKDPFPGNIIPASRLSPIALGYLQYLPTPTSDGPLNNYLVPSAIPDSILGDSNYASVALRGSGYELVPMWSPEFSFVFDPNGSPEEIDQGIRARGIRGLFLGIGVPVTELYARYPFFQQNQWQGVVRLATGYALFKPPDGAP